MAGVRLKCDLLSELAPQSRVITFTKGHDAALFPELFLVLTVHQVVGRSVYQLFKTQYLPQRLGEVATSRVNSSHSLLSSCLYITLQVCQH